MSEPEQPYQYDDSSQNPTDDAQATQLGNTAQQIAEGVQQFAGSAEEIVDSAEEIAEIAGPFLA